MFASPLPFFSPPHALHLKPVDLSGLFGLVRQSGPC
jgi:hypothetical protein